jgi:hypothetical protein
MIVTALRPGSSLQIGAPELDSRCTFFASEGERLTRWLQGSFEARVSIQRLLDLGLNGLSLREGAMHAKIVDYSRNQLSPEYALEFLGSMAQLARSVEGA